ncbi:DUF6308 family protein [Kitasatospora sp. NPDC057692]|uniref:DUF6308 family protein n=1 Tax=Kitasatospora sp. NPDC057692 TaxID=3346215 RepID=UPI0036B91E60
MKNQELTVGGHRIAMARAIEWTGAYFDEKANTAAAAAKGGKPYAYPVYDRMDTGSGPNQLNDGDLLAPLLLNVRPTIKAVSSLQVVRPRLEAVLASIPQGATLQAAVVDGSHREPFQALGGLLDRAGGVPGVGGTTLMKILHRKRPLFIPLYDTQVYAAYCGTTGNYPLHLDVKRTWAEFFTLLAESMAKDIDSQSEQWMTLASVAPDDVSLLRILDVLAWNLGKPE